MYLGDEEYIDKEGKKKKKQIIKSVTVDDPSPAGKRKCERLAAEMAVNKPEADNKSKTFGDCIDEYIKTRSRILSPKTVKEYKSMRKNIFPDIMDKPIDKITRQDIQKAVNADTEKHAPKTVKNHVGLLTTVFSEYRPDFNIKITMPQKKKFTPVLPTEDVVRKILKKLENDPLYIPVLLALFGPMRRGEIAALDSSHIDGNTVYVQYDVVLDEDNKWVKKQPKTEESERYIEFPKFVIDKIKDIDGNITDLNPAQISNRWRRFIKNNNLPAIRFHDLRHYSSSVLHAEGVADAYIKERAGWKSDHAMNIYRHALQDEKKKAAAKANKAFENVLLDTKLDTK